MGTWRRAGVIAVALTALAVSGSRLAAQTTRTAPRMQGVSFVFARYTSGSALSLYLARRIGPAMVVSGAAGNLQSGYRAALLGGGTHVRLSADAGVTAIVAAVRATDGASARVYLLPHVTAGPLALDATTVLLQPLGGEARREAAVNPLSAMFRLARRVRGGVVATLEAEEGSPVQAGLGPGVQLRVSRGTLALEVVVERPWSRVELRGSFSGAL